MHIAFQIFFVIFQANHGVGRYFTVQEILHFRELQATTGAIISGSTALQFFDRTVYADSDLDLYVQHDRSRDLALWLESIGYMFVPLENDNFNTLQMSLDKSPDFDPTDITFDSEYCDGVIILNFIKKDRPSIQVITSRGPAIAMVLQFHSSASFSSSSEHIYVFTRCPGCVMNFITHDKAFSIHPRATFIERQSLVYDFSLKAFKARLKYTFRGWTQIQSPPATHITTSFSSFRRGLRRVGDRKCWTINLDPIVSSHADYITSNTWSLQYSQTAPVFATHIWVLLKEEDIFEDTYLMDLTRYIKAQKFLASFRQSRNHGKG